MDNQFLEFIKKVQSIAQIGLSFSTDPYAVDNYEELKKISVKMLHDYTSLPMNECNLYKDFIYPTPQPAVRSMVIKNHQLLLVTRKIVVFGHYQVDGVILIAHRRKQLLRKRSRNLVM
ncbi:MAG: NUDIX hydrolase N-terminal domain-containing protein [Turicibacter sp.]